MRPERLAASERNVTNKEAIRNRILVFLTLTLNFIYLYWRARYTLPLDVATYGVVSLIAGLALFFIELMGALESLVHFFNMSKIENHPVPDVPLDRFPDVDIFIATYTEPLDLLYKTINGCKNLDYPDKSKVHLHLCDDGHRAEARELAEQMGINYIDREDNKGAKAGNLNNAMTLTSAPLVVTLDADMIPQNKMLMRMVPYFVDSWIKNEGKAEKDKVTLGFVQSPQSFYNPDLFQFNLFSEGRIPNEQDYFYKDVQVARNRSNSVIYGGSNTMLAREAINSIGGFFTDAITEDFATGILMQKAGFICYAVNEVLASGLSATDLTSLIAQRVRWARGCIQTGRKMHILLTSGLSLPQKANYWASVWYWYSPVKRLIYIMSPLLFAVFGYIVIRTDLLQTLMFWLPMYVVSNITLKFLSRNIRTNKWTAIYETVLFPFMLFPVILEFLGVSLKKFRVTKKDKVVNEKGISFVHAAPFALFILLSIIGIVNCVRLIFESGTIGPVVVLFWMTSNLFNLAMSLFFVLGRNFFRTSERVLAEVDCELRIAAREPIFCKTMDFSETGVALRLPDPVDIDEDETVEMILSTDRYHSELKAKVVHVSYVGGAWKYAFKVTDHCGTFDDYLQILYDRTPTLPTNLSKSLSSFDDLRINITKRTKAVFFENRHYPRIDMEEQVVSESGATFRMVNFNYKYVIFREPSLPKEMRVTPVEGLWFNVQYDREIPGGRQLYIVKNYDEIHGDREKSAILAEWTKAAILRMDEIRSREQQFVEDHTLAGDLLGLSAEQKNETHHA